MCLIIAKKSNVKMPKLKYLKNADANNSDGIGICWRKPSEKIVHIKKDFKNVKKLYNFLMNNIKIQDELIIHFRLATSGLTDKGNRHPFPLSRRIPRLRATDTTANVCLAHNGVIINFSGDKKLSDTQRFCKEVLSEQNIKDNIDSPIFENLLEAYADTDKFAILHKTKGLFTFGNFKEEDGLLFSNNSYNYRKYSYFGYNDSWYGEHYKQTHFKNEFVNYTQCDYCGDQKPTKYIEDEGAFYYICEDCEEYFMQLLKRGKEEQEDIKKIEDKTDKTIRYCEHCGCEIYTDKDKRYFNFDLCHSCYADLTKQGQPAN